LNLKKNTNRTAHTLPLSKGGLGSRRRGEIEKGGGGYTRNQLIKGEKSISTRRGGPTN